MTKFELAKFIDHTNLHAEALPSDIERLCSEAGKYNFASVCINPVYVALAAELLKNSDVKVCTVIGFPLGAGTAASKAFEAADAVDNGAQELDMVINIGALKSGNLGQVEEEIRAVVLAADGRTVKVIIETCLLTDEEKVSACLAAKKAGADFVKTSTGFSTGGATPEDILLMRKTVGSDFGVKASGGIRSAQDAILMIKSGANRIGTSAGVKIVESFEGEII
ncbi:MAG: deoxyribose-phosphate aldolase [Bacillota bacterium]|nr:deoxyribose-phosphate aldolase [Bacillota bacterium]